MLHYQVVAPRKEIIHTGEGGKKTLQQAGSVEPIVRFASVRKAEAEEFAGKVFKREGILPEIYEMD